MFGAFVVWFWTLSSDAPNGPCSLGRECAVDNALLRIWIARALEEMGR